MASPRVSSGSTTPMHPWSFPFTFSVTKTPHRSAQIPSLGILAGRRSWRTASFTANRARSSRDLRSASERDGILRLLARFQHAQFAALLDTVVHLAPEAQEILRRGNQCAGHH